MIYAIGDSHSSVFAGVDNHIQPQYNHCYVLRNDLFTPLVQHYNEFKTKDENFISIRTGANTAYNMLNKTDLVDSILRDYKVSKTDDRILFCYGEIDTRVHIGKQEEIRQVSNETIIEELVDRYIKFLLIYVDKGYQVMAWGVPPSGHGNHHAHPKYCGVTERNNLSRKINKVLSEACNKNGIPFINIWHEIVDSENYSDYFQDPIHLKYSSCKPFIYDKMEGIL